MLELLRLLSGFEETPNQDCAEVLGEQWMLHQNAFYMFLCFKNLGDVARVLMDLVFVIF